MTLGEKVETKDKILIQASKLFSQFGYQGASVREIATASDVNIAAINYHFGSKHNLYWATVQRSHTWLNSGIEEIAKQVSHVEELALKTFQLIMTDPEYVRSAIKIMMTDGVPAPDGSVREDFDSHSGPPGANHFAEVIRSQVPEEVGEIAIFWAVKSIFGNIVHWSMMCSSSKYDFICASNSNILNEKTIAQSIHIHAQAIIKYLEQNYQKIENQFT